MERVDMAAQMTDRAFCARRVGTSLALVMLSACSQEPAAGPAQEQSDASQKDCQDEVAATFARLKTSGRPYRKESTATSGRWTYHEIVEFVPPDQMRLTSNNWMDHGRVLRSDWAASVG